MQEHADPGSRGNTGRRRSENIRLPQTYSRFSVTTVRDVSMKIDHDEFAEKLPTGATGTAANHPEAVKPAQ
jgi:hypothetical protein